MVWWARIVACMGEVMITYNRRDTYLDTYGRIILKRTLKKENVTVGAELNWLKTRR